MTKKELSQFYYLKREIKEQQRRIAELETLAINCSTKITGLPTGTGISDKIGNYAAQIADLKALLDLNLKKCFLRAESDKQLYWGRGGATDKTDYDLPIWVSHELVADWEGYWRKKSSRKPS